MSAAVESSGVSDHLSFTLVCTATPRWNATATADPSGERAKRRGYPHRARMDWGSMRLWNGGRCVEGLDKQEEDERGADCC